MHCEVENNWNYDPRENKAEHQSQDKKTKEKEEQKKLSIQKAAVF